MGSAAAATEEERREKERKRIALEEALRKAREEQERLEELKRQAVASISADRSVTAIKSAATAAAGSLGRGRA
jgi:uncharacterized membrane-anchored protein YjiN (DUF445 family)